MIKIHAYQEDLGGDTELIFESSSVDEAMEVVVPALIRGGYFNHNSQVTVSCAPCGMLPWVWCGEVLITRRDTVWASPPRRNFTEVVEREASEQSEGHRD